MFKKGKGAESPLSSAARDTRSSSPVIGTLEYHLSRLSNLDVTRGIEGSLRRGVSYN